MKPGEALVVERGNGWGIITERTLEHAFLQQLPQRCVLMAPNDSVHRWVFRSPVAGVSLVELVRLVKHQADGVSRRGAPSGYGAAVESCLRRVMRLDVSTLQAELVLVALGE